MEETPIVRTNVVIGIATFFLIILIVLTLVGNIIVIIAATTYYKLKEQHSNMFIVNLAVADLCVVLIVMFCSLIELVTDMRQEEPLPIGLTVCSIQCAMNYCLIVVSMMTLGFVSVDRLVHIVYPLKYVDIMTVSRIKILITCTWIQGVVIGFTPVCLNWIRYDYYEIVCAIDWSHTNAATYVIVAFITCFIAPGLTMVVCYSVILKEIRSSMSRIAHERGGIELKPTRLTLLQNIASKSSLFSKRGSIPQTSSPRSTNQGQRTSTNQHQRIVRSLLVVVFVFFLCMTPFCVTKLIKVLDGRVDGWVNTLATFVQLAASGCNPFIYGIFRNEFRNAFRAQYVKILHQAGCKRYTLKKKSINPSTTNNNAPIIEMQIIGKGTPSVLITSTQLEHSKTELTEGSCIQLIEPVHPPEKILEH